MKHDNYQWDSIEAVIQKHSPMLYRIAYSYTGSKEDSEDVLQEVFIKYAKQKVFKDEEHSKAWLIRVTINHSINTVKAFYKKKAVSLEYNENRNMLENMDSYSREQSDDMKMLIMELPLKYRSAIYLYYYEGYKVEEIAEILGKKTASIYTLLNRGRDLLKKAIEEGGNSDE